MKTIFWTLYLFIILTLAFLFMGIAGLFIVVGGTALGYFVGKQRK